MGLGAGFQKPTSAQPLPTQVSFQKFRESERIYNVHTVNVHFQLEGLAFSWDSEKAASNTTKHGLSFERACEVFLDPLVRLSDASAEQQERFAAVGSVLDGNIVYVVHLEFADDHLRIISARHATRQEIARYEDNG